MNITDADVRAALARQARPISDYAAVVAELHGYPPSPGPLEFDAAGVADWERRHELLRLMVADDARRAQSSGGGAAS